MNASKFTRREREVLEQLQLGKTNKEIAVALALSVKTAEFHVRNVLWKAKAKSRKQLARPLCDDEVA
jgi:DNA-binding NarL/FixJ family response regulator